jgi:hypothetical protein
VSHKKRGTMRIGTGKGQRDRRDSVDRARQWRQRDRTREKEETDRCTGERGRDRGARRYR